MRYYAYCRTSTETQKKKNGCNMQMAVIEEYCQEKKLDIQECFVDDAISGTTADRPELNRKIREAGI